MAVPFADGGDGRDPPLAVLRFDVSAAIGGGHMMRCAALAETLAAAGWRVGIASRGTIPGFAAPWLGGPERLVLEGGATDEPDALGRRWPGGADVLVVDHYERALAFERQCRPWARRIAVIEDLPDRRHDADVLIDAAASPDAHRSAVPATCRRLLGPEYALLRRAFAARRPAALARRAGASRVERILVSFGAGDPGRLPETTMKAIDGAGLGAAAVDLVLPATEGAPRTEVRSDGRPGAVAVHRGVRDMAALMEAADLAVGAAGGSAFERACLGLPSIVAVTADNQGANAEMLQRRGAALPIDARAPSFADDLGAALRRLASDAALRATLSRRAAALCDGRGAERVLLALADPACDRKGGNVTLRLAADRDCEVMFAWQIHPQTRLFSRNPSAPSRHEHVRWFSDAIADSRRLTMMIERDGEPAGVLRIDPRRDTTAREVSVLVAPELHGRGIAGAALGLARRILPGPDLYAFVKPGNIASRRLFVAAGFRESAAGEFLSRGRAEVADAGSA